MRKIWLVETPPNRAMINSSGNVATTTTITDNIPASNLPSTRSELERLVSSSRSNVLRSFSKATAEATKQGGKRHRHGQLQRGQNLKRGRAKPGQIADIFDLLRADQKLPGGERQREEGPGEQRPSGKKRRSPGSDGRFARKHRSDHVAILSRLGCVGKLVAEEAANQLVSLPQFPSYFSQIAVRAATHWIQQNSCLSFASNDCPTARKSLQSIITQRRGGSPSALRLRFRLVFFPQVRFNHDRTVSSHAGFARAPEPAFALQVYWRRCGCVLAGRTVRPCPTDDADADRRLSVGDRHPVWRRG